MYNDTLKQIESAPIPEFRGRIRQWPRKEWAAEIRCLLKSLHIKGVSVTTPNYSMASSVDIRLPNYPNEDADSHMALHEQLWRAGKNGTECPDCARRWQAKEKVKSIILAAFPDLDDRSDTQSDYFDFCFTVQ